jgi:hypothetical protein
MNHCREPIPASAQLIDQVLCEEWMKSDAVMVIPGQQAAPLSLVQHVIGRRSKKLVRDGGVARTGKGEHGECLLNVGWRRRDQIIRQEFVKS